MEYNMTRLILFLTPILMLSACEIQDTSPGNRGNDDPDNRNINYELSGNTWELRSIQSDGYDIYAPQEDTSYYARFNEDGTLAAKSKCNSCGGEYVISEDTTIIVSAFCTEALCGPASEYFDYGAALSSTSSYYFDQDGYMYMRSVDNVRGRYLMKHVHADSNKIRDVLLVNPEIFVRENWLNYPYSVLESEIMEDTLSLKVGFSGCGPHGFNMVFYNYFLDSNPVEAQAILSHKTGECGASPTQELKFDLSSLKEEFFRQFEESNADNNIMISIIEDGESLSQVLYEFNE